MKKAFSNIQPDSRATKRMMHPAKLVAVTFGLALLVPGTAGAQPAYPSKPIRMIVPNPPGGGVDLMGRIVGQRLSEIWGQQVIVDNRPGGHGFIGGQALANSAPDGYTLMAMSSTHIITPLLYPAPYDPIKDFAAISMIARGRLLLVVHPSLPARTLQEFIAPQVPTFTQAGLPGFDIQGWFGFLAPAGTPRAIIERVSTEIAKTVTLPKIRETIIAQGAEPYTNTPEEFAAMMRADTATFAKIIKTANIKADE